MKRFRTRVAIVAASMDILGGHAVQAQRLLDGWAEDPEIAAWLVPIDPRAPGLLRHARRVKYVRTAVTQLSYWPLLVRELRRADLVHVFSASYTSFLLSPLPAMLVARALGRPILLNYHSGEGPDHLRRSALARAALARVDRLVVPSPFLRDAFLPFGLRADVVPNVIDLQQFPFRLREALAPKLVSTRNFEPHYHVACTLRAFRAVQQRFPEATLTLVGAGSCEPALRALASDLGLSGVRFAGRVPPDRISRCYADADIYVQTPDVDNMPISMLEAFASGTAVVSTAAGGVPAIVRDGMNGLLAPVGDDRTVATHIVRLLEDPPLARRLALAAREACEEYTWPRVRPKWAALYRGLASAQETGTPHESRGVKDEPVVPGA